MGADERPLFVVIIIKAHTIRSRIARPRLIWRNILRVSSVTTLTAATSADGVNEVLMAEKKAAGKRKLKTLKYRAISVLRGVIDSGISP